MKKYTIITSVTLALLIVGSVAYGQMHSMGQGPCPKPGMQQNCPMEMGDGHGRGMHGGKGHGDRVGMLLRVAEEIGLSEDQIARLKTMQTDFRKQRIDDRAELQKAKIDLEALKRDQAESGAVVKAIDQIGRLKTELAKKRYLHREEMKMVLTGEQLEKLEDLRKQHRETKSQGRGHGKGHGQGRGMGMAPSDADSWDLGWLDESEL